MTSLKAILKKLQELIKKLRRWEKKVGAPKLTINPDYAMD